MATVAISIEGFSQLRRKLKEFPLKVSRKADKDALRAGAMVFKRAAKIEAPRGQTRKKSTRRLSLWRRIGFRSLRRRRDEVGFYVIRSKSPHSNLVQLGTSNRQTKRGARKGGTDPNDYMARAFRKASGAATVAISNRMKQAVAEANRGL